MINVSVEGFDVLLKIKTSYCAWLFYETFTTYWIFRSDGHVRSSIADNLTTTFLGLFMQKRQIGYSVST